MDLQPLLDGVAEDLRSLGALGDERTAEIAQRLAEAVAPRLRLRLFDLLGEAALEVSASLPSGHVEVRLSGQEPGLVFVDPSVDAGAGASEELSARITLRLPETLKTAVERAAEREDLSVNAWLLRALKRAVDVRGPSGRPGRRLTGYAES